MNATDLISYVESSFESSTLDIQTYRINSNVVSLIRHCMRDLYTTLFESERDNDVASYLRLEILKLQSSPTVPTLDMLAHCRLDDIERNKKVWGQDIANICIKLGRAIQRLNENNSPLLDKLVEVISIEIEDRGLEKIKIWCHRNEREIYTELFKNNNIELTDDNFICSLAEYRETDFFEVLVRLGPLRSQGWSKTPRVIISAPRYSKFFQFVWTDTLDEKEFGIDPVLIANDYMKNFCRHNETIISHIQLDDISDDIASEEIDDFTFLTERPLSLNQENNCVLIELSDEQGVLLVPGSHQLIFDQNADSTPFLYKDAHEIEALNYLLLHDVEADLSGNEDDKNKGVIAPLWKQALSNMYNMQYKFLLAKMKESGINLLDLDRAARKWMQSGGDVIHGPQTRLHFQALLEKVLPSCLANYSWTQAWQEILDSRIQAIQDGRIESSIANEQLTKELYSKVDMIREHCSGSNFFRHGINPESGVSGTVMFYPVLDVSLGFKAPHDKLGSIRPVKELEAYRVDI